MELEGGGGDPHGMQCQISCSRSPSLRAVLTVLCSHQRLAIVDCTCSWLSVPAMVVIASPPYLSSATPSMLPGDECRDEFHISIKAFRLSPSFPLPHFFVLPVHELNHPRHLFAKMLHRAI